MSLIDATYFYQNHVPRSPAVGADTTRDSWVNTCITHVSQQLKDYCNQPLEQEDVTQSFFGNGKDYWIVPFQKIPVAIKSGATLQKRASIADAWENETDTVELDTHSKVAKLRIDGIFSASYQYRLAFTVGYASGSVPSNLKSAAARLVQDQFLKSPHTTGDSRLGVKQISKNIDGVAHTTVFEPLKPEILRDIAQWRRIPL